MSQSYTSSTAKTKHIATAVHRKGDPAGGRSPCSLSSHGPSWPRSPQHTALAGRGQSSASSRAQAGATEGGNRGSTSLRGVDSRSCASHCPLAGASLAVVLDISGFGQRRLAERGLGKRRTAADLTSSALCLMSVVIRKGQLPPRSRHEPGSWRPPPAACFPTLRFVPWVCKLFHRALAAFI